MRLAATPPSRPGRNKSLHRYTNADTEAASMGTGIHIALQQKVMTSAQSLVRACPFPDMAGASCAARLSLCVLGTTVCAWGHSLNLAFISKNERGGCATKLGRHGRQAPPPGRWRPRLNTAGQARGWHRSQRSARQKSTPLTVCWSSPAALPDRMRKVTALVWGGGGIALVHKMRARPRSTGLTLPAPPARPQNRNAAEDTSGPAHAPQVS